MNFDDRQLDGSFLSPFFIKAMITHCTIEQAFVSKYTVVQIIIIKRIEISSLILSSNASVAVFQDEQKWKENMLENKNC